VGYHVIKTVIVNIEDELTTAVIASYHAKGQKDWQVDSYVKPPKTVTMEGIDKTISDIENYILTLPEWEGATIEE
jgi:hypothetical protein